MSQPKLSRALLQLRGPKDSGAVLCIDFGTALSKAAASNGSGYRPILMSLGRVAEDPRASNRYVAESSLFIDQGGTVHFGHSAVSHWARQRTYEIARLDSMKRWLSAGPIGELDRAAVEERFLPSGYALTKGEALTLIFAYVTDLACRGLVGAGLSRYVKRRFARPVYERERELWCDQQMATLLGRAQLIADSFSGRWNDGIALNELREVIDLAKREAIPEWLVDPKGVPEPIAAGHWRMEKDEQHRYLALVIDVGAGTTDLAVFTGSQGRDSVGLTRARSEGRTMSLLKAGDHLDGLLQEQILSNVPHGSRNEVVVREVEGRIRGWKETLFVDGVVRATFTGGIIAAPVEKESFCKMTAVRQFGAEIQKAVEEVFDSVGGLADKLASVSLVPLEEITVLLSGGGAGLPMVTSIIKKGRRVGRHIYPLRDAGPAPEWLRRYHPDTAEVYQQMAVAIGGAFPMLPGPPELKRRPPRISL